MENELLRSILLELRATNEALFEMKQELKKIKEDTNFLSEKGVDINKRIAIASEKLSDKFNA